MPVGQPGYWIFDLATFQLKKVDPSLKVIFMKAETFSR
jgi:hypothetical protein